MTTIAPAAPIAATSVAPQPPAIAIAAAPVDNLGASTMSYARRSGPVVEFGRGFRDEIRAQGLGFVDTAKAIWKFVSNPGAETIRKQLGDLHQVAAYVARHPAEAAKAMGRSVAARVIKGYREGNFGYAAGALIAIVGAAAVTGGAAGAAVKAIKSFISKAGKRGAAAVNSAQDATRTAAMAAVTAKVVAKVPVAYPVNRIDHSFKHVADFGVAHRINPQTRRPHSPNTAERAAFQRALEAHIRSDDTVAIEGTYWKKPVIHFLNPQTGLLVVRDAKGDLTASYRIRNADELRRLMTEGDL